MTIFFSEEEKKWLIFDLSKKYPYRCKEDAPKQIKESIERKIEIHKKWLKDEFGSR